MSRLVFLLACFLLAVSGFGAVYALKHPEQLHRAYELVRSRSDNLQAVDSMARASQSAEFSPDTELRLGEAGRVGKDPRVEFLSRDTGPRSRYRSLARGVVRIDLKFKDPKSDEVYSDDTCTGFLIDSLHVVTARHCLDNSTNSVDDLVNARILLDYLEDGRGAVTFAQLSTERDTIIVGPSREPEDDFAILQVSKDSRNKISNDRALSVSVEDNYVGDNLFLLHHPLGNPLHLSQTGCFAESILDNGVLFHACKTYPGSSGAPVFSDLTSSVVAIHSSSKGDDDVKSVSLSRISEVISMLGKLEPSNQTFSESSGTSDAQLEKEAISIDQSGLPNWDPDGFDTVDSVAPPNDMSNYILATVDYLAKEKSGLGYGSSDYFTETMMYGDYPISGKNSPSTMCVAAVTEVLVRSVDAWAREQGSALAYAELPGTVWTTKTPKGLWPWLFQWNMEMGDIPSYGRTFGTGARDAFVLFGIGQSVKFEDARPGDILYFNRAGGRGHAVVFLSFLEKDYKLAEIYSENVVGFKYFSSQSSGTAGLGYRAAYFSGYCPKDHAPSLRKDCRVIRTDDPKLLSIGRLSPPQNWSTFDASIHIDALFNGATLEEIESRRYSTTRSSVNIERALELDQELASELTIGPAVSFTGETVESEE